MAEKLKLDLSLVLPDVQDERDACVGRVTELLRGDQVVAKPGQRISAYGVVAPGNSAVDQSPVTGESMPVDKQASDKVFAGTVNGKGALLVEVMRLARESPLARMVELVAEAQTRKSPTQRFTDHFERAFVPVVLMAVLRFSLLEPECRGCTWDGWGR
ncbi:P-type ATPase [Thiobacillus sp.]